MSKRPYVLANLAAVVPAPAEDAAPSLLKPWEKTEVVGKAIPRVDGYERASGSAVYPADISLPNMLYGKILRCPHPHAKVKSIDLSQAAKLPGVRAVISASSPGCDLRWYYDWGAYAMLFDEHCLFEGDEVAAVAAETPYAAADALRAIKVEYEVLPFIADHAKALESNAPQLHEKGNRVGDVEKYQRGDVEQGFAAADVVLEQTYTIACQLHTPLEPHGCVATWDGGNLTVWESTQGVYGIQPRVAQTLGLPQSKVRVINRYMGGGFGSKLDAGKYTIIAALLARTTGQPVKMTLSREETYLVVGNRPPATMRLKAGVKKDGTLTALEMSVLATGGAHPAGGAGLIDWLVRDLYTCPNVRSELTDVFTNAGVARPFRAPGHPQGAWALEQMMDALAEKIQMDPVDLRLKNIPSFSQARGEGKPPYTTTGLKQCLEEGAKAFGWTEALKRARDPHRPRHPARSWCGERSLDSGRR